MSGTTRQRLLVFIVAYNAEKTIQPTLQRIPARLLNDYEVEVLVIDDSSTDRTSPFSSKRVPENCWKVPRTVEMPMCFTENWIWLCAGSNAHCMVSLQAPRGALMICSYRQVELPIPHW